jgi:hypothetical protein
MTQKPMLWVEVAVEAAIGQNQFVTKKKKNQLAFLFSVLCRAACEVADDIPKTHFFWLPPTRRGA